ncbi:protein fuzzy homolog [Prorops nasuta]|uniref:protein fuzzy homolog n=1 Tax=Prorops nasuta TaxID=863751 RepID=UPI0034CD3821
MSAHLMCLTSAGGIPIFARQKGDGDAITFSKMASLNGVHMFLKSQNINLFCTDLPDTTVVWKEFENSIILIIIASGATKYVLDKFLNSVFSAMVFFVGIDEIRNLKNVEKLKKDLRFCNPIIDRFLECLDVGEKISARTDFVNMIECVMPSENHLLQTCLDGYVECLDSMYGCILIHGCLAVATTGWWSLDPVERKLLIIAVSTEGDYTVRDLPVFLPCKSPNVAFRLVSVTLISNVEVLALCGPSPDLTEIERLSSQCWKNSIEALRSSEQCYPRNISSTISLDSAVLGFLLVNYKVNKFVLAKNSQSANHRITGTHRLDILRTFYHQAVETFIDLNDDSEKSNEEETKKSTCTFTGAKETYWCSEYHKCHAVKDGNHVLSVLYTSTVPAHTMRLISQKILKTLLADKQTCW